MTLKVAVVDDDSVSREIIESSLKGHDVVFANDLKGARSILRQPGWDIIVLDIMLPDGDGLALYAELAHQPDYQEIPFLFLTGKSETSAKLLAFSLGAEDFLVKPVDPLELRARVEARCRKKARSKEESRQLRLGNLLIDLDRQAAFRVAGVTEKSLDLTALEFKIFVLLTKRLEQVYSRTQMIDRVWGDVHITDRTVDSHVAHLRQKMKGLEVQIESVKGLGYRAVRGNKTEK